jgi:hypothetical protein
MTVAAAVAKPAAIVEAPPAQPDPARRLAVAIQKRAEARAAVEHAAADFKRAGKTLAEIRIGIEHLGNIEACTAEYVANAIAAGGDGASIPRDLQERRQQRDELRQRQTVTEAAAQRLANAVEQAKTALRQHEAAVGQAAEAVLHQEVRGLTDEAQAVMRRLQVLADQIGGASALWLTIPNSGLSPKPLAISPDAIAIMQAVATMRGPHLPPPSAASDGVLRWQARFQTLLRGE